MKFREIDLYTADPIGTRSFYTEHMGLSIVTESAVHLTVQIGWTRLTFRAVSLAVAPYYVAVSAPPALLDVCADYYQLRPLHRFGVAHTLARYATAGYCLDNNGNVILFIGRSDLPACSFKNKASQLFQGVTELGMATECVPQTMYQLNRRLNIEPTTGCDPDQDVVLVGDDDGRFLLLQVGINWPFTDVEANLNYCKFVLNTGSDSFYHSLYSHEVNRLPVGYRTSK